MEALGILMIVLAVAGAYLFMRGMRLVGGALVAIAIVVGLAFASH